MDKFVLNFLTQNLNYKKETSSMVEKLSFSFSFPINVDHKGTIRRALVMDLLLIFFPLVWFKAFRLRFRLGRARKDSGWLLSSFDRFHGPGLFPGSGGSSQRSPL